MATLLNEWKVLDVIRRQKLDKVPFLSGPSRDVDLWAWRDEHALYHVTDFCWGGSLRDLTCTPWESCLKLIAAEVVRFDQYVYIYGRTDPTPDAWPPEASLARYRAPRPQTRKHFYPQGWSHSNQRFWWFSIHVSRKEAVAQANRPGTHSGLALLRSRDACLRCSQRRIL